MDDQRQRATVLVRLLGIFFVIDGIVGVIGFGVQYAEQVREANIYDSPVVEFSSLGWLVANALAVIAGLVLIFKSNIALDAIFHEKIEEKESRVEDADQ